MAVKRKGGRPTGPPISNQDPLIAKALELWRSKLVEFKQRRRLSYDSLVARALGIPEPSYKRYLGPYPSLPSPGTIDQTKDRLKLTPDECKLFEEARARRLKLQISEGVQTRRRKTGQTEVAGPEQSLPRQSVPRTVVSGSGSEADNQELVDCFQQLLVLLRRQLGQASRLNLEVPQLLKRLGWSELSALATRNLRALAEVNLAPPSQAEAVEFLEFFREHVAWVRVCLLALVQLKPEDRQQLLSEVGRNLDLFWKTGQVASALVPTDVLQDMDLTDNWQRRKGGH